MSFNAIDVVLDYKKRYRNARGGLAGVSASSIVPRTTWKDVYSFGVVFLAKTANYQTDLCQEYKICSAMGQCSMKFGLIPSATRQKWRRSPCPPKFQETSSYLAARKAFELAQPFPRLYALNPITAVAQLSYHLELNDEYPYNADFWNKAEAYAIARNAAGSVPSSFDLAVESIREAAAELPQTIAGALDAVLPKFPSFGLDKLMMWSAVGLGVYFVYKFGIQGRGKKRKKKAETPPATAT